MPYPIAMTTYERPNYLKRTLKSLETSGATDLYIRDDCSNDPDKLALLDEISGKYSVVRNEWNAGAYINLRWAVTDICNLGSDLLVYVQDDIIVARNWLSRGVEIFREIQNQVENFALLSLYNWHGRHEAEWFPMTAGHPGGCAWILSREWWLEYIDTVSPREGQDILEGTDRRTRHCLKHLADYKICKAIHGMGWKLAHVGKSLVQHMGDKSIISGKDMRFTRSKNFVGEN